MAKQSALEKSIKAVGTAVSVPEPPYHLNEEQAAEWRRVVYRMPADWFPPEVQPFLAQFCCHMVTANWLSNLISDLEANECVDPLDPLPIKQLDLMCKMRDREVRAATTIATKLRFTTQSLRSPDAKKPAVIDGNRPWEL
ncbi:hypothetical protein [Paracoccus sp. (in: a-proteobacteria)]|uniref:hypothetical protein n=1 Tax=Paracoccus sp. TaxID=267 RepID=UPI00405A3F53